jgi:hypothetical protein
MQIIPMNLDLLRLFRFSKRTPLTMESLMADIENKVRRQMQSEAVTPLPNGGLRVDPNRIYISREEGQRALKRLQQWQASQQGH